MHEKIMALAGAIASPNEAELPLLEALCTTALAELSSMLREGVSQADCENTLACAAALLAAAGLLPCREAGGVEQFTVGEVSIRTGNGDRRGTADALRRQAMALMAPYCRDDSFSFLGVRG